MTMGPAHSVLWPARRTKTYAASPTDADGIKTLVATSLTAQSYSGAALNGALANPGPAVIDLPMTVSVTTTVDAATYNTTDPIVITGTDGRGAVITDSITLTQAGGNETVAGTKGFATVTSIAVPAQLTVNGEFTFGVLDTILDPPAKELRSGGAGNVVVAYGDGTTDTLVGVAGEHHPAMVSKVTWSGTTLPLTVYVW